MRLWLGRSSSTGTGQLYLARALAKPGPARCGCRMPGRSFPDLKLTLGGRLETWRALDGFNVNTTTTDAPAVHHLATAGDQSAGTELDEFLAKGLAVVRPEQGLEYHGQFR